MKNIYVNKIIDCYEESKQILLKWDNSTKKDFISFSYGPSHYYMNENSHKTSLIKPAEKLLKTSHNYLPTLRKELTKDEVLKLYDKIVKLIIDLAIKHINNHKSIKGDIDCYYLFHNSIGLPMSKETEERHLKNYNIIFNKIINSKVHPQLQKDREKQVRKLYNSHEGEKGENYYGQSIFGEGENYFSTNKGSGCFIATMVYGDYDHHQVLILRDFRDDFLANYNLGNKFIKFYYKYSPSCVDTMKNWNVVNLIIKKILNLFIKFIKLCRIC